MVVIGRLARVTGAAGATGTGGFSGAPQNGGPEGG